MRKIILVLAMVALSSCKNDWQIMRKRAIKAEWCKYDYSLGSLAEWVETEDSCNKYNVGDTIRH